MTSLSKLMVKLERLGVRIGIGKGPDGSPQFAFKGESWAIPPEVQAEFAAAYLAEQAIRPDEAARATDDGLDAGCVGWARPTDDGLSSVGIAHPTRPHPGHPAGPDLASRAWRRTVALWPVDWRRRWGTLANSLEERGEPWDHAEWRAFHEVSRELVAAEDLGEVPEWSYPSPSDAGGLTDAEAVAAIDRAFADFKWPVARGR